MTLDQQIEEAILSTLVVENKESIKRYCVPKIMAIVEKYGSEMLHEYPPVYHSEDLPRTELQYRWWEPIRT